MKLKDFKIRYKSVEDNHNIYVTDKNINIVIYEHSLYIESNAISPPYIRIRLKRNSSEYNLLMNKTKEYDIEEKKERQREQKELFDKLFEE